MAPAARLRLFYFLYYGYVGTYLPYFAAYLRGRGFSGETIGLVQMLPSLLAPAVALAWAAFADRRGSAARGLRLASAWASIAVLLLPFARTPIAVGAVVLLMALGDRAVVPLADSVTIEWTREHPRFSYARIRLFGSLGFIVLAVAVGRALTLRGDLPADLLVPVAVTACVVGYGLVAGGVPALPQPDVRPDVHDLRALLSDRHLHVLLAACAVHWAAAAPFHLFFGVYVRDLGLPADVTGIGMAIGVGAEILALLLFPRLESRFSPRVLFGAAFLGSALRWALLSQARAPVAVAGLQVLHGLTFGLFWGAAMKTMADAVPPRLRATGQALFSAVVFGGGNAAGYALSGMGYDRFGGAGPLFAWAAAAELVPLVAAWLWFRRRVSAGPAASSPRAPS